MRRPIPLPNAVKDAIRQQLASSFATVKSSYDAAAQNEDTMTRQVAAGLRIRGQRVMVSDGGRDSTGEWTWGIDSTSSRGRGSLKPKRGLGADGILELQVSVVGATHRSSLLFQSKLEGDGDRRLLEQSIKLSTWRGAACVLEFARSGFRAAELDHTILKRGASDSFASASSMSDYFGRSFLDGTAGDNDLRYEPASRRLIWRARTGEIVATRFSVRHRIQIWIEGPRHGDAPPRVVRELPGREVHNYRMQGDAADILALAGASPSLTLKERHRQLILAYHPDRFGDLDGDVREIANRRTQEINAAYDRERAEAKRK